MDEERERFYSRLATIPGLRTLPSIGSWILVAVDDPQELARKVNGRLAPDTITVPPRVQGTVRVPVRDPKHNEALYRAIRDIQRKKVRRRHFQELKTPTSAAS